MSSPNLAQVPRILGFLAQIDQAVCRGVRRGELGLRTDVSMHVIMMPITGKGKQGGRGGELGPVLSVLPFLGMEL